MDAVLDRSEITRAGDGALHFSAVQLSGQHRFAAGNQGASKVVVAVVSSGGRTLIGWCCSSRCRGSRNTALRRVQERRSAFGLGECGRLDLLPAVVNCIAVAADRLASRQPANLHRSQDVDKMRSSDPSWNTGQGVELACEFLSEVKL